MHAVAAAGAAATIRAAPIPAPSPQSSRKEWRAVSDHSARSPEDLECGKLGHSEERTIYEVQQGSETVDVDFCSITIDSDANADDLLQERLHVVALQREELQQMEIELRAQMIARVEIMEMRKSFDSQLEENANAASKLKEQILEREKYIHELEKKMDEKDRELCAIKLDNEAAWAKEDLLREQNKELAVFRRQRDTFEVERAQNLKKIHELKEHVHEKENQYFEMEEQHRVAQETIHYKDEQLREAQAWVARLQEMDALQSSANHSLQAELQERTEQFNQFWLGCQRQFQEMERHHMHVVQQFQLQLLEAREQKGIHGENSEMAHGNTTDSSRAETKVNVNEVGTSSGNSEILLNGNCDSNSPFASGANASAVLDHPPVVPIAQSSILGVSPFLPPGQLNTQISALHPLVMHQQGVPHSTQPANIPQSHLDHFQTLPAISSQHWQNQQAVSENSQMFKQAQIQQSQNEPSGLRSDGHNDNQLSGDGVVSADYHKTHTSLGQSSGPVVTTSADSPQVGEINDKLYVTSEEPKQNLRGLFHFHDTIRLDHFEKQNELQADNSRTGVMYQQQGDQSDSLEQSVADTNSPYSVTSNQHENSREASESNSSAASLAEVSVSTGQTSSPMATGKSSRPTLLEERSLLACIVRAIPAGSNGRIRISTTLPNRLGKMLAPLHWHDYKKQYGKLDDFVAHHPELFVIEGDYIHLREGAQAIISATTAIAKFAAATAAVSAPSASLLPSVAVTPVAQSNRPKRVPANDSSHPNSSDQPLQFLERQDQHSNRASFNIVKGLSNVKILSKPKGAYETNGFPSEVRSGHPPAYTTVGNGPNHQTGTTGFQNRVSSGRNDANYGGKPQGRATGAGLPSRK